MISPLKSNLDPVYFERGSLAQVTEAPESKSGPAWPVDRDLQGGFCRQRLKHNHRNTDSKIGPGGQENRPGTPGKRPTNPKDTQKLRDPAQT